MPENKLDLTPGVRIRTGGATYEVRKPSSVDAGVVEVVPQSTRMHKVNCPKCGYVCRVTRKWLLKSGFPICPACEVPMVGSEGKAKEPEVVKVTVRDVEVACDLSEYPDELGDYLNEAAEESEVPASTLAKLLDQLD